MNAELQQFQPWLGGWLPILLDAAIKGAALLAMAALAVAAMRRASAAARHWVWMLALAATLALPPLSLALPGWRVLPAWAAPAPGMARPTPAALAVEPHGQPDPAGEAAPQSVLAGSVPEEWPGIGTTAELPQPREPAARPAAAGVSWAVIVWAAGAVVCLLPLLLGRVSLWRLARTARPVTDGSWRALARQAAEALGLRRNVVLLQSDAEPMPMVWGTFRPRLVLPREADAWTPQRRRVVLLHELAHARRHDCLNKLVAHVACAAYWFNPLAWWAFKRMQGEAESACDDLVLAAGHRPSDYATHLLEIASGLRAGMLAAYSSIAMAGRSRVEGRVLAILDENRNRRSLTRRGLLIAAVLVVGLAVPMAILKAAGADEPSPVSKAAATQPATASGDAGAARAREPATKAFAISPVVLMVVPRDDDAIVKALRDRFSVDLTGLGNQALIIRDHADEMPGFLQDRRAKVLSKPQVLTLNDAGVSVAIGQYPVFRLSEVGRPDGQEFVRAFMGVQLSMRAYAQDGTAMSVEFTSTEPLGDDKVTVAALECVRHLPPGAGLLLRVAAPGPSYRLTGFTGGNRGADGVRNDVQLVKEPLKENVEPTGTFYVWIIPAEVDHRVEATQPAGAAARFAAGQVLSAKAREFIDLLRAGKFDEAVRGFDEQLAKAMPPDKLREMWGDLEEQYGSCALAPSIEASGRFSTVLIQTIWARSGPAGKEVTTVYLRLAFDATGKITELAVKTQEKTPATLPAATAPGRRAGASEVR